MGLFLRYAAALAFFICVAALLYENIRTSFMRRRSSFASPRETGALPASLRGILYAFGWGMMPWEKESARKHLLTYFAGVAYHVGVFAGLFYLFCVALYVQLDIRALLTVRVLLFVGAAGGLGLFLKRVIVSSMRAISCPDDYVSNLIVNAFLLIAAIDTFSVGASSVGTSHFSTPAGIPHPAASTLLLLVVSIVMFLYIPIGKIRHCFFFFHSRILLGSFYGRRGVWPSPARKR